MAATQPAQLSATDDDIADWMAQRWRDVAKPSPEAQAMGRQLWAQAKRSGQNLAAPHPSDLRARGSRFLGQGAHANPLASQQQADSSQTFVPSPGTPTLQALRQQQAQFGKVQHDLSIQNSPYALPALLPAALLALDVPAALGVRGLLSAPAKAFNFPELEAWQVPAAPETQAASSGAETDGSFPYAAGRARLARANGGVSASEMNADVHHSLPVQYSDLFPNADPNRLANLWALRPEAHQIATRLWSQFARNIAGRIPTQAEVMAQKLQVDGEVAPYVRRPGVPRSNIPRTKGGLY